MDYEEIGRNIKYVRIRKGLKQYELAEIVGVTSEHISHIECAKTRLSLELLVRIANVLTTDINDLLGKNIEVRPIINVDEDLNELFKSASPALRTQCKEICRAAVKYGNWV